jgi:hypothetical protein
MTAFSKQACTGGMDGKHRALVKAFAATFPLAGGSTCWKKAENAMCIYKGLGPFAIVHFAVFKGGGHRPV